MLAYIVNHIIESSLHLKPCRIHVAAATKIHGDLADIHISVGTQTHLKALAGILI